LSAGADRDSAGIVGLGGYSGWRAHSEKSGASHVKDSVWRAGCIIAARQAWAAVILCLIFSIGTAPPLLGRPEPANASAAQADSYDWKPRLPLDLAVALADLLIAIGIVATSERPLPSTARAIGRVAKKIQPASPRAVVDKMVALTALAALGCAILTIRGQRMGGASLEELPPGLGIELLRFAWPGICSIGFAFFAATARAARLGRRLTPDM
jgi:hypothetical protein